MSNRGPNPGSAIPTAELVPGIGYGELVGVPVDAAGNSLIPELANRAPTHNESYLIAGGHVAPGSSNVQEIWWAYDFNGTGRPALFVEFKDSSIYRYDGVPLSVAVAFVESDSAGRFVWNHLRDRYPYEKIKAGDGHRKPPTVVRVVP